MLAIVDVPAEIAVAQVAVTELRVQVHRYGPRRGKSGRNNTRVAFLITPLVVRVRVECGITGGQDLGFGGGSNWRMRRGLIGGGGGGDARYESVVLLRGLAIADILNLQQCTRPVAIGSRLSGLMAGEQIKKHGHTVDVTKNHIRSAHNLGGVVAEPALNLQLRAPQASHARCREIA